MACVSENYGSCLLEKNSMSTIFFFHLLACSACVFRCGDHIKILHTHTYWRGLGRQATCKYMCEPRRVHVTSHRWMDNNHFPLLSACLFFQLVR